MKSWWKVSLLINGSSEKCCYPAKSQEVKTAELQFDKKLQSQCYSSSYWLECPPPNWCLIFTLVLLLMLLTLGWAYSVSQFGYAIKAQHAFVIKKTPLAYRSTVSVKKIISSMPTHALNLCLVAAYNNCWGDRLWLKQINEQMWADSFQPQVNLTIGWYRKQHF